MFFDKEKILIKKHYALHRKYEQAVTLYIYTGMTLQAIAEKCSVSVGGLSNYLRRYQRALVLKRHQIPMGGKDPHSIKIIAKGRQSSVARTKYREAIEACGLMEYIGFNVSQIARMYNLSGTALANFMRVHYPDLLVWREKVRLRLGINDNILRGARPECTEQYAEAVELYRSTDMSLPEVAEIFHLSERGLSQHLRFYHKDILKQKDEQRRRACTEVKKKRGDLLGNGRKYEPSPETEHKYAEALNLYIKTSLTIKEIVRQTEVSSEGFRFYLHKWYKKLVLERSCITGKTDDHLDLRKARYCVKTVFVKYREAIESLRQNPRPVAQIATEFGFHPDVFRNYLRKHEPELAEQQGMMRTKNGKLVSRRSEEKYTEAIQLYETTSESLKSIAKRLGLNYNSLGGYVRRNYPEVIERHNHFFYDQG